MAVIALGGCGPTWDPDADGVPRLARVVPVDVGLLDQVSRFRSAAGHDFSDSVESCRSMKHYLWPKGGDPGQPHDPSWATIEIRSPVDGRITDVQPERTVGSQLWIESSENPAFVFRLFHVNPRSGLGTGDTVVAGEVLGRNATDDTYTDVAVEARQPFGTRLVSFFETLTDEGFAAVAARGVPNREALIIPRSERDAAPLSCTRGAFTQSSPTEDWVRLR